MSDIQKFFKKPEDIVAAIKKAEQKTSGEIKIHIEAHCDKEVMARAKEVFELLGMHQLPQKNGVLIYVAVDDHKLCILGDKNIDEQVGLGFWNDTIYNMTKHFKQHHFDDGIIEAILETGRKLRDYFPYDKATDTNDLNDDISYGK